MRSRVNTALRSASLALAAALGTAVPALGAGEGMPAEGAGQSPLAAMAQQFTPELREKVDALSPETKQTLMKLHAQHPRRSDSLTLRQVMGEILADYQVIVVGIATDNGPMAADAARRLANHRIPRGGLLPYLPLEKVTDEGLAPLVAMNEVVEGGALRLAEDAEQGDMPRAASLLSEVAAGCVSCHQMYRGQPGVSPRLMMPRQ